MTVYVLCFLALFVCSESTLKKNSILVRFLLISVAFVFCFGYMTGSDWRSYESYYSWFNSKQSILEYLTYFTIEPGYVIYSYVFSVIGFSFWPFFIITKLILFFSFITFIKRFSVDNYLFNIMFFLGVFGLFLFIDNPMRNLIAVVISLFSYKYLEQRKFTLFLLVIIVAVCFHISALLLLLVYPFYPIKITTRNLTFVFILFFIFSPLLFDFIIYGFIGAFSFIPLVALKLQHYFIDSDSMSNVRLFTFGNLFQFSFGLLLLYKRQFIESIDKGKIIFFGTICYLLLYRLASGIEILYRFQLYFLLFYVVGLCTTICAIKIKSNKIIIKSLLICYLVFMIYSTLTSTIHYIPYSNYVEYLFSEELPFEYRSNYNYKHSPYGLIN